MSKMLSFWTSREKLTLGTFALTSDSLHIFQDYLSLAVEPVQIICLGEKAVSIVLKGEQFIMVQYDPSEHSRIVDFLTQKYEVKLA